ncbi:chorismate mutase [Actinomadura yumaensis]|uniref:chorismate mutase n=1 Tax=Actinomadura yumaensis TaxID=111807 RepID=A0ABW2CQ25_9ACTN
MVVAVLAPPGAARAEVPARSLAPLVRVAAERLALADRVAAAKWGTGRPIEDAARERELLADVARRSGEMGIDPGRSVAVFRDQIEAAKLVERGLFLRWQARPGRAPAERPDLEGEVRPALDRVTGELLAELKATRGVRADPFCGLRLAGAVRQAEHERRLDGLHLAGLGRAVPSVCEDA